MRRIVLFLSMFLLTFTAFSQKSSTSEKVKGYSLEGKKAPEIVVEKWINRGFNPRNEYTLIDFWDRAVLSDPEESSKLGEVYEKFKWRMNIVALVSATEETVLGADVKGRFVRAIDTKETMVKELGIKDYPHAILIDELGIIRWSGKLKDISIEAIEDTTFKYKLYGKPFLNQKAPEIVVENWFTEKPDMKGKFVLIDFWATTCATCVQGIPNMNKYREQFKDDLVVIGLTNEREERVRGMKDPVIEYAIASDTKMTLMKQLELKGIPYALLIDPKGVVRWEGFPGKKGYELTAEIIKDIIQQYK